MPNRRSAQPDDTAGAGGLHEETWGATEAAKREWFDRNGDKVRKEVEALNEDPATAS